MVVFMFPPLAVAVFIARCRPRATLHGSRRSRARRGTRRVRRRQRPLVSEVVDVVDGVELVELMLRHRRWGACAVSRRFVAIATTAATKDFLEEAWRLLLFTAAGTVDGTHVLVLSLAQALFARDVCGGDDGREQ